MCLCAKHNYLQAIFSLQLHPSTATFLNRMSSFVLLPQLNSIHILMNTMPVIFSFGMVWWELIYFDGLCYNAFEVVVNLGVGGTSGQEEADREDGINK